MSALRIKKQPSMCCDRLHVIPPPFVPSLPSFATCPRTCGTSRTRSLCRPHAGVLMSNACSCDVKSAASKAIASVCRYGGAPTLMRLSVMHSRRRHRATSANTFNRSTLHTAGRNRAQWGGGGERERACVYGCVSERGKSQGIAKSWWMVERKE